jgi:hypothetical protein
LRPRKALHVSAWAEAGAPTVAAKTGSSSLMRRPSGTKYMLATECSKPAATKALIGGTTARTRSVVVRAENVNQTPRGGRRTTGSDARRGDRHQLPDHRVAR